MSDGAWLVLGLVGILAAVGARRGSRSLVNEYQAEYEPEAKGYNEYPTRRSVGTLPTELLMKLPGARGEHRLFDNSPTGAKSAARWTELVESIAAEGIQSKVFVVVEWTDDLHPNQRKIFKDVTLPPVQAFIYEGNHRVRIANELGITEVPVEVKWFGHAERETAWPS